MNREQALEKMLPSWTKVNEIKDFIIVDWSSEKPIIENKIIKEQLLKYPNIKIIRVEGEKYFYRCLAWNLAFQNTNIENKILLKLDVDYLNINHSWIDSLNLTSDKTLNNYFLTGCDNFMRYSFGFLLVNKYNFKQGYNENMEPVWGFEDHDLYSRIRKENIYKTYEHPDIKNTQPWDGLNHIYFFNIKDYIYHIPHSEEKRFENLKYSEKVLTKRGLNLEEGWKLALKNRILSEKFQYWEPKKYRILTESTHYKQVEVINENK